MGDASYEPPLALSLWRGPILLPRRESSFSDLLTLFSENVGVSVEDLKSANQTVRVSERRQDFMLAAYETGRWSTVQIGKWLGGRHHTTVLHGLRRARDRLK